VALIARTFVVLFAFFAASMVAGLVLTLGLLPPEFDELAPMPGAHAGFGLAVAFSALLVSGFALIPALLFIALAEGFRLRSFVFYAGFGAAIALLTAHGWNFSSVDGSPAYPLVGREQEVFAAAGIAAGLAYWALAGRKAGAWRAERARSGASAR
jgi:hypothetical protein